MAGLPNGLLQSYNAALTKLAPLRVLAQARENDGVTNLNTTYTQVGADNMTTQSHMTIFAAGFKDMKTYAMASSASEDPDVGSVIGGTCSLIRNCANGKIVNDLLARIEALALALVSGSVAEINALISQISLESNNVVALISELSNFTGWLSDQFKMQMESFSKFLMLAGGDLGTAINALTECFAAAAIYDEEASVMYNTAVALSADLSSGTLPVQNVQVALRSRLRIENDFAGKITSKVTDIEHNVTRTAMLSAITQYRASIETPPVVDKPLDYIDPTSSYDFGADSWVNQLAEWEWLDNNSVQLNKDNSLGDEGVLIYNDLSNPQWQGTFEVNLQSFATNRKAAGLLLGRNDAGQRVGILKRGTTGLGLFVFDPDTLVVPTNYIPIEDHASGLEFDSWIDISGVSLRLIADETHYTVMAQEFGTTEPFDLLQVVRSDLAMIEVGLITLDADMMFHCQKREDA